jgi:hypothetical protein
VKTINLCAAILILAGLALTGCPQPGGDDKPIDSRLKGMWSNGGSGDNLREFSIQSNGSFTASINPALKDKPPMGRGKVTGKLANEGDEYRMNGLKATLEPGFTLDWGPQVENPTIAEGQYVKITFDGDDKFNFAGVDQQLITDFFGGDYTRQESLTLLP